MGHLPFWKNKPTSHHHHQNKTNNNHWIKPPCCSVNFFASSPLLRRNYDYISCVSYVGHKFVFFFAISFFSYFFLCTFNLCLSRILAIPLIYPWGSFLSPLCFLGDRVIRMVCSIRILSLTLYPGVLFYSVSFTITPNTVFFPLTTPEHCVMFWELSRMTHLSQERIVLHLPWCT